MQKNQKLKSIINKIFHKHKYIAKALTKINKTDSYITVYECNCGKIKYK